MTKFGKVKKLIKNEIKTFINHAHFTHTLLKRPYNSRKTEKYPLRKPTCISIFSLSKCLVVFVRYQEKNSTD